MYIIPFCKDDLRDLVMLKVLARSAFVPEPEVVWLSGLRLPLVRMFVSIHLARALWALLAASDLCGLPAFSRHRIESVPDLWWSFGAGTFRPASAEQNVF